jgi:hypothetical protein
MNNRIQQLIEECIYTVTDYSLGIDSSVEEFDKEKFAKLIAEECACLCYNNDFVTGSGYAREIEKHFGVE